MFNSESRKNTSELFKDNTEVGIEMQVFLHNLSLGRLDFSRIRGKLRRKEKPEWTHIMT